MYFKITNSNETHHGIKYKKGLIEDPHSWNQNVNCAPGGIYFTDKAHICAFLYYGIWLREVTIPNDAKVSFGYDKHKANKVIIGKRWDLRKVETWKYLVSIEADIHKWDDNALIWAAQNGHLEVVKYLIEQGADIHTKNDRPLRWAAEYGHLEVVKYLVEQGADIHAQNDYSLVYAAKNGHLEVVKYLVEQGVDIHAKDDYALRWAAANGYFEIVRYLVEQGADIHADNDDALRLAEYYNHTKIVNYLKRKINNDSIKL